MEINKIEKEGLSNLYAELREILAIEPKKVYKALEKVEEFDWVVTREFNIVETKSKKLLKTLNECEEEIGKLDEEADMLRRVLRTCREISDALGNINTAS